MQASKFKVLSVIPPNFLKQGISFFPDLMAGIQPTLDKHVSSMDTVTTMEEYEALTADQKSSYDIVLV